MVTVILQFIAIATQRLSSISVSLTLGLFHYTDLIRLSCSRLFVLPELCSNEKSVGQVEERALTLDPVELAAYFVIKSTALCLQGIPAFLLILRININYIPNKL
jgi:hypothetical protein